MYKGTKKKKKWSHVRKYHRIRNFNVTTIKINSANNLLLVFFAYVAKA